MPVFPTCFREIGIEWIHNTYLFQIGTARLFETVETTVFYWIHSQLPVAKVGNTESTTAGYKSQDFIQVMLYSYVMAYYNLWNDNNLVSRTAVLPTVHK